MTWKDTIGETAERVEALERMLKILMTQSAALSKRLERIERLCADIAGRNSQSVEHMADRLIQMSMVQRGESREASVHRRTAPGESVEQPANLWGELPDDAQWPPKNVNIVAQL